MASPQRPCPCGGTSFHVLPNLIASVHQPTTVIGLRARQKLHVHPMLTLVVCTQCTRTEMFTVNAAEIIGGIPGAYPVTASSG